jgi:hypothetical protein
MSRPSRQVPSEERQYSRMIPTARKRKRLLEIVATGGKPVQLRCVRRTPPACDAMLGLNLGHPLDIRCPERTKHDIPAAQERRAVARAAHRCWLRSLQGVFSRGTGSDCGRIDPERCEQYLSGF